MARARTVLEKALALSPKLARANFFYARVLRSDGNYEGAAQRLRIVLDQYPRDRVALNDLGRVLFLQRKYDEAVKVLQSVLDHRPGRPAGALQPDALLQRHWATTSWPRSTRRATCGLKRTSRRRPSRGRIASFILRTITRGRRCMSMSRCLYQITWGRLPRLFGQTKRGLRLPPLSGVLDSVSSSPTVPYRVTETQNETQISLLRLASCLCVSVGRALPGERIRLCPDHSLQRHHRAGGHTLHPQQRRLRKKVAPGNHGPRLRLHRLRQRRISRHSALSTDRIGPVIPKTA